MSEICFIDHSQRSMIAQLFALSKEPPIEENDSRLPLGNTKKLQLLILYLSLLSLSECMSMY